MKCFELQATTGLDALKAVERAAPKPGPNQVLVKVRAASFNYRDVMIAGGGYAGRAKLPLIPLSDGAGEVVEAGSAVARVKAGDRVCGTFFQRWLAGPVRPDIQDAALGGTADGMLTELALLEGDGVVPVPDHLSYEEAATLPCAALTAWHGLVEAGGVKPGDAVLLLGTGGVSIFGLQFAKLAGARAIVVSTSDDKLKRARELGASEAINSKSVAEWQDRVRAATGGRGVDHVLDVTGGETTAKSLASLRPGGHIAIIGARSGPGGELDRRQILQKGLKVTGINVGSRAMFEAMNRAISANRLKPLVDRTFPFKDAVAAYREFATGKHFGKVVIAFE
ncbi:MAG TPA: NAD(P)-dependent alcohol dehydrogenase [Stellaceae bacterium]|nr:NAD(P)-dependent alcohol dehydrogenase [Stellaceae bacterium]